jgi:polyadenylate-binding protein
MEKTLFVSNLDATVTKSSLKALFHSYGNIKLCNLYSDRNGNCRGFAYITFEFNHGFRRALNSTVYDKGRLLRLEPYIGSDQGLQMKDEELSRLRVCVLGVPKEMVNEDFEQIFSSIFGEIQNAYIKQNAEKKKNLGFVTFMTEEQTKNALRMRIIKISRSETLSLKSFTARKTHKIGYTEIFQRSVAQKELKQNLESHN